MSDLVKLKLAIPLVGFKKKKEILLGSPKLCEPVLQVKIKGKIKLFFKLKDRNLKIIIEKLFFLRYK